MKNINGHVNANLLEKFIVFAKQSMGKPQKLNGQLILVRHFSIWRLVFVIVVLLSIVFSYIEVAPWFLACGFMVLAFLTLFAFLFFGKLYFDS